MTTDMAVVNGVLTPLAEARISVLDLGLLRGLAVFETLRTYGGHPHALREHLDRLESSCRELGIILPFDAATLRRVLREALERGGAADLRVTVLVTPGDNVRSVFGADRPNWVVLAKALHPNPATWYDDGVSVATFDGERYLPGAKTTTYITGLKGLTEAERGGCAEALYVGTDGMVSEGVTSNVLLVRGGNIITPSAECLAGITRMHVERLARAENIPWRSEAVRRHDLYSADEVWITSSVREVVPVVRIDGRRIGDGRPGPLQKRLHALYRAAAECSAKADA